MQCRTCGTEIADKAIVCFRCGAGTTDPVRRAAKIASSRRPMVPLVILVGFLVLALYLAQASRTAANPEIFQLAAGLSGGAAVAVLLVVILRRR
jgi:hypothetical protein